MSLPDLLVILPFLFSLVWAILVLIVDLWIPASRKGITAVLAAVGLAAGLCLTIILRSNPGISSGLTGFSGMVELDSFTLTLQIIFLASGLLGVTLAFDYLKRMKIERGEYYPLIMLAMSGMMLMSQANDLIMVFLGLELLSIPLYVLTGFANGKLESEEAALKYFFMGAFASGFVLFGTALIFGATGTTNIPAIVGSLDAHSVNNPILLSIGAGLLLVGLGFKAALAPFHMWVPDVYQGAPTPVTAFMSVGTKIAAFAILMRIFLADLPIAAGTFTPIFIVISVLTMGIGTLLALKQTNLKRLLAYSSISSAGFLLMAFVPFNDTTQTFTIVSAMTFYLVTYTIASFGAWGVVIALEQPDGKGLEIEEYAGLWKRSKTLTIALSVLLFSYAGLPLTLGFWGKLYILRSVITSGYWWLALIGLLISVIAVFYYLKVIAALFQKEGEPKVRREGWLNLVVLLSTVAVIAFSLVPGWILNLVSNVNMVIK